jgi:MFS family permease
VIRGESLLTAAAEIQPFTVCGALAAFSAAWLIRRLPAQYILAIGSMAMPIANILLATMPAQQIYWQTACFAVCFAAFCPDFIFTAAQIIASNSVSRNQQGIAGSLIGTLLTYGMSTGIGFGGTLEVHTNHDGTDIVRGYRSALYLGIGFAAASLVLSLLFFRIKKDEREGWEEKDGVSQEMSGVSGTELSAQQV